MSDALSAITAPSHLVTIGGTPYRVSPLSYNLLGELEAWINRQLPDPIAMAKKMAEGLPDKQAEAVIMEGFRMAMLGPVRIQSPEAARVIESPAGGSYVLWLSLRTHQPNLMLADMERLVDSLSPADFAALQKLIFDEDQAPKSPAATGTTATPARRRGARSSSA